MTNTDSETPSGVAPADRQRAIPRYDAATNTVRQVHLIAAGRGVARCGTFSDNKTDWLEDVTCKRCRKIGGADA